MFARTFRRRLAQIIIAGVVIYFAVIVISRAAGSPFPFTVSVSYSPGDGKVVNFTATIRNISHRQLPFKAVNVLFFNNSEVAKQRWQARPSAGKKAALRYTFDLSKFPVNMKVCFVTIVIYPGLKAAQKCIHLKDNPVGSTA